MRSARSMVCLALGLAMASGLAACSTDGQPAATPEPVTVTVTASAPAGTSAPATTTVPPVTTTATPAPTCSTDGNAAITAAMNQIPPPFAGSMPDNNWIFEGETNYNTCYDLSYAAVETARGTASSPSQLLMFHRGNYVGPAIACNAAFQTVTGSTPSSVNVTYRWPNPGDANANPTGQASVVFEWNGSQVVMDGSLPYEVTRGKC